MPTKADAVFLAAAAAAAAAAATFAPNLFS
jgi:hypothetical protein